MQLVSWRRKGESRERGCKGDGVPKDAGEKTGIFFSIAGIDKLSAGFSVGHN